MGMPVVYSCVSPRHRAVVMGGTIYVNDRQTLEECFAYELRALELGREVNGPREEQVWRWVDIRGEFR